MNIKEYVFKKGVACHIPVSGTFELTPRCNLSCRMCYIHMTEQEQRSAGQELTTAQWLDIGRQAVEKGMLYLLLTGGEPLLRPDFREIYTEMLKMGVVMTVNTNAVLMNEEIVSCFQRYRPENVNVTLYGSSAETYGKLCGNPKGFERAVHGIKMLKEAEIRVNINTTFTRYNLQDMDALIDFAKEEKIPIRMAAYIFPPVRNGHEAEQIYLSPEEQGKAGAYFDRMTLEPEKLKKRQEYIRKNLEEGAFSDVDFEAPVCEASSCMAGRGAFWISWDGCMFPCGMLPDTSVNLKNVDFSTAWQATIEKAKGIFLPAECTNCIYKKACPSCAAVSQSVNQTTDQVPKDLCARTKAYVEAFSL